MLFQAVAGHLKRCIKTPWLINSCPGVRPTVNHQKSKDITTVVPASKKNIGNGHVQAIIQIQRCRKGLLCY